MTAEEHIKYLKEAADTATLRYEILKSCYEIRTYLQQRSDMRPSRYCNVVGIGSNTDVWYLPNKQNESGKMPLMTLIVESRNGIVLAVSYDYQTPYEIVDIGMLNLDTATQIMRNLEHARIEFHLDK